MHHEDNWAVIVPMANEELDFAAFVQALAAALNRIGSGRVYLVVDRASKDKTLQLCQEQAARDRRFSVVWAPENRNLVEAYMRGYKEAYANGHELIIEMDAGLSHDPAALPMFLRVLSEGNTCAFGCRYMNGGSMVDSPFFRRVLSLGGTKIANLLLGTRMLDMTSGYQGFHRRVVEKFVNYPLLSTAHFYQTELRYLLSRSKYAEVPIHYRAPSPRVPAGAIANSLYVLGVYFLRRITFRAQRLNVW